MGGARRVSLTGGGELLQRELADRLQQAEPGFAGGIVTALDQTGGDQNRQ
jgi:hypothetical protein